MTCGLTLDQMSRYHGLAKLIYILNMRGSKQLINNLVKPWLGVNIYPKVNHFSQLSPVSQLCLTLCNPMNCRKPGLLVHHQFLEFTQTHGDWVSDAIQPSHPLLSPSSPTSSLSQHQGLFQWVSSSHQVAKVLEFQLQHQSFQWLTSFRIDSFDVLVVQRTLKSLLQHHSSKASILQCSAFFMVQLSHPYITTGKP